MIYHNDVVIRMPIDEAIAGGYQVIDRFQIDVTRIGQAKELVNMAYVKSTLTNIPFFKGNNFEYTSLLSFLGDNANSLIWIVFVPVVIFIITAVSNAANLTDGIDGLATGSTVIQLKSLWAILEA